MNFNWKTFLKNRLNKEVFTGLPLTIFVTLFLILLGTFVGITDAIVNSTPIVKVDNSFAQFMFSLRLPLLAKIFYGITYLGDQLVVTILAVIFSAYLFFKKELAYLYSLLLAVIGNEISVYFIKIFIDRSRPTIDITYIIEKSNSFPSGHSAIAMSFYGFIIYYLLKHISQKNIRPPVWTMGILIIILIGFSRLYLVVLFLSDVLGGFAITERSG